MTQTPVTQDQHHTLVAKLIGEANDGVRIRHCGRKTFSEDPVWRGLRVGPVCHREIFNVAHASMDMVRAAFAVQNERGAWRELSADEAWPIYEEAFISDRYHGFIFESDYHSALEIYRGWAVSDDSAGQATQGGDWSATAPDGKQINAPNYKALIDQIDAAMVACGTHSALAARLADEADLCRNDGASDIAALLDEARAALGATT